MEQRDISTKQIKTNHLRFVLIRNEDVSGVSGTGIVAEGIEFSDGMCVIKWLSSHSSINIYNSVKELLAVHGHEGRTTVSFVD